MNNDERKDVEYLKELLASVKVPTLCGSCGANLDYHQCFCAGKQQPLHRDNDGLDAYREPVAIAHVCELGENCRCVKGDEPGCWNWIEKVEL
jgi:hypothetical protein